LGKGWIAMNWKELYLTLDNRIMAGIRFV
jgi:hypothetical protein